MIVDLTEAEWNAVLSMIAMGPWREANPLLMKIGEQLRAQQPRVPSNPPNIAKRSLDGADHGDAGHGKL